MKSENPNWHILVDRVFLWLHFYTYNSDSGNNKDGQ